MEINKYMSFKSSEHQKRLPEKNCKTLIEIDFDVGSTCLTSFELRLQLKREDKFFLKRSQKSTYPTIFQSTSILI